MAKRRPKIESRRNAILSRLQASGKVTVTELARELDVTIVTIRKDLDDMDRDGLLTRVSGGAVLLADTGRIGSAQVSNLPQKQAIAREILSMVKDGDTIFINSGTTSTEVARALTGRKVLNIVTNSYDVVRTLNDVRGFRVILLGGEFNSDYSFTYGSDAQEQLSRYKADWAILSVNGVSVAGGITTYHAEEAILDRIMISSSDHAIIAADHTKVGTTGFSRVCDVSDRVLLVTDTGADPGEVALLAEAGVKTELV